ncbi:MAG: protein kinase [Byssovorax sp.]
MTSSRPGLEEPSSPGSLESRYELLVKIASGGMATVYLGQVRGAAGFRRQVAIKRAHPHLLENPTFKQMLVDEARLASRIHHPNVISVLDVEERAGELLLVMDYVEGAALSDLLSRCQDADRKLPARVALRVALDACAGLHAAHELCDEHGRPLGLVHRDISPHNILVGVDGAARIADFGIAKHAEGGVSTTTGSLKGKIGYMAPEYVEHGVLDARSDVFALGIVVWESLANRKLFRGQNEVDTLRRIVSAEAPPLSAVAPWVGARLDDVLAAALARLPSERFDSARAFGNALESAARKDDLIAPAGEVARFVEELVGPSLEKRRSLWRERSSGGRPASTPAIQRAPAQALQAEPTLAGDRPTVPDKPSQHDAPVFGVLDASEPAMPVEPTGSVGGSSRSLRQIEGAEGRSAPSLPRSGSSNRTAIIVAAVSLLAGAIGALALLSGSGGSGSGAPAAALSADPESKPSSSASAQPIPTISPASPDAPTSTAPSAAPPSSAPMQRPAVSASSRLPPPRPGAIKPGPASTAAPADRIAPNPYATPPKTGP